MLGTVFVSALAVPDTALPPRRPPVPVILDTDIGPDCDDAGALAVLHVLADRGEASILGVICCTSSEWGAPCCDAINTYYGRPGLPVGTHKGEGFLCESRYNEAVARSFPTVLPSGREAPDARDLYRRLLAAQPDRSVTVCAIGPVNNLRDLLHTGPDEHSPVAGAELVAAKVDCLVVMGGEFPSGEGWNFTQDGAAARDVCDHWPTPILFSGKEIGLGIMTGSRLYTETPPENPVRRAYELWTGGTDRPSWDQTTVLAAVQGLRDYWTAQTKGYCHVHEDGSNEWRSSPEAASQPYRRHAYLVEKQPPADLARVIEDLMVTPPRQRP